MTDTTILLVDSATNRRIILNVLLSAAGYHVVQATTLREVSGLARHTRIDLAISALALPDGRAEDVPALLRRGLSDREIAVIGIAPQNDHAARLRALGAGLDEVLMSPVEDRILLARLRTLLTPAPVPVEAMTTRPGFAEAPASFAMAEPVARLAIAGSDTAYTQPCFDAMQNHPDLHLIPVMRQAHPDHLPNADCLLMQVSSVRDVTRLRRLIEDRHRARPSILAVVGEGYYLPALEAGAEDAMPAPPGGRELLIRVRSQLRRRARAQHRRQMERCTPPPIVQSA